MAGQIIQIKLIQCNELFMYTKHEGLDHDMHRGKKRREVKRKIYHINPAGIWGEIL